MRKAASEAVPSLKDLKGEVGPSFRGALDEVKKGLPKVAQAAKEGLKTTIELGKEGIKWIGSFFKNFNVFEFAEKLTEKGKGVESTFAMLMGFLTGKVDEARNEGKSPEEIAQKSEEEAKKVKALVAEYKENKDPSKLRYYFIEATRIHESGNDQYYKKYGKKYGVTDGMTVRLVTTQAIAFKERPGRNPKKNNLAIHLEKQGVKLNEALVNRPACATFPKGIGKNLGEFKTILRKSLQPAGLYGWKEESLTEAQRKQLEDKAVLMLGHSALGIYQIVPQFHFRRLGWKMDAETLYAYLSSPDKQRELVEKVTNDLGEKYDWNPLYMAAEYYSGSGGAKKLKKAITTGEGWEAVTRGQTYGFNSIYDYSQKTVTLMEELVKKG